MPFDLGVGTLAVKSLLNGFEPNTKISVHPSVGCYFSAGAGLVISVLLVMVTLPILKSTTKPDDARFGAVSAPPLFNYECLHVYRVASVVCCFSIVLSEWPEVSFGYDCRWPLMELSGKSLFGGFTFFNFTAWVDENSMPSARVKSSLRS